MALLDFYGMFDYESGDDDTYKYSSTEFSELIAGLAGTGVSANTLDTFTTTYSGLNLTVGTGVVFINGRYGSNKTVKTISLTPEETGFSRIDRLVIELDVVSRTIAVTTVTGISTSGTPVAPTLTQTATLYQLPLYAIKITEGSIAKFTDERVFTFSAATVQERLNNCSVVGHTHALSDVSGISLNTTASNIKMNGTQSAGSGTAVAKANHVHPVDTSRAAASHTHELADVSGISFNTTASNIKMNGTQSAGSGTTVAKANHVHPVDTSRAEAAFTTVSGSSFGAMGTDTSGKSYSATAHVRANHVSARISITGFVPGSSANLKKQVFVIASAYRPAVGHYGAVSGYFTSTVASSYKDCLYPVTGFINAGSSKNGIVTVSVPVTSSTFSSGTLVLELDYNIV